MKREDYKNNQPYLKAMQFVHENFGTPDAFVKKVVEFAEQKLVVDGYLSKPDYDLFCFHILSEINRNLSLGDMILTGKFMNDAEN
jgi:hypothetical protein